jgi:glycosyltransferase involved in cell wall biosynthesis
MKVLLASNASYDPPKGGSTRSNLAWLRHLAAGRHDVRVVAAGAVDRESVLEGVSIRGVRNFARNTAVLAEEIRSFEPEWLLVSSEDLAHVLLREAARRAPGRIVYLAHTPQWFPFGPESWNPDPEAAAIVRHAAGVAAIGEHMADYIERHAGRRPAVVHPPVYGRPPFKRFGRFGDGYVLMINPCAVKGLAIFLGLADRFPRIEFAALDGWGTTSADRRALAARPNCRLLATAPDIEDVLCHARVLLMPSLWYEGFGLIAMEAMLRGIPVIASDSGGLQEAKRGTGYVIPVRPVERYLRTFDETGMPEAVIPPQDIGPWAAALARLLEDEPEYRREAERSRARAVQFVGNLDAADFERFLESLPRPAPAAAPPAPAPLDAARRALLAKKMAEKKGPR